MSEMLNSIFVYFPLLLFVGLVVFLLSLFQRIILSVVLSAIITGVMTWLLFMG